MADDSVLCSLRELHDLESQRIERETSEVRAQREEAARVAAEAARTAAAERRAQEAAQEAEAKRLRLEADARARLDVDAEVSQATLESRRRVEALRAELEAVQSERRFLHERAMTASTTDMPTAKSRGWAVGFALMSTIAMALAALLVVQSSHTPAPKVVIREVPVPVEVRVPEERLEVAVESVPPVVEAPEVTRPTVTRPARPRPTRPARPHDALGDMDECGDDPLCML